MADEFGRHIKSVAGALGAALSDDEIQRMPREFGLQGNFNYSKFLEHMRQFKGSEQREEFIRKAFQSLDKDNSGYIEWNEIKYIVSLLPESAPAAALLNDEEVEALMQAADEDGDGRINFKEFSALVKKEQKSKT